MYIYKQFHNYIPLNNMSGLQWFSLIENYGESYGPIHIKYKFIKTPKLLDIGNANIRESIINKIKKYDKNIIEYSDPDYQYSGGLSNKKYHNLVKQFYNDDYDGTIIDINNLTGNDTYSHEDLEGASEIVLWKDYSQLLQEVTEGGKNKKNITKKLRKNKKNKSIILKRKKRNTKIIRKSRKI